MIPTIKSAEVKEVTVIFEIEYPEPPRVVFLGLRCPLRRWASLSGRTCGGRNASHCFDQLQRIYEQCDGDGAARLRPV